MRSATQVFDTINYEQTASTLRMPAQFVSIANGGRNCKDLCRQTGKGGECRAWRPVKSESSSDTGHGGYRHHSRWAHIKEDFHSNRRTSTLLYPCADAERQYQTNGKPGKGSKIGMWRYVLRERKTLTNERFAEERMWQDPTGQKLSAYLEAREEIRQRVEELVASHYEQRPPTYSLYLEDGACSYNPKSKSSVWT